MKYFIKSPFWLRWMYPKYLWRMNSEEKVIYLSFDDGPHAEATPFVLDILAKYDAKATFFCIGKNVASYPDIYKRILQEGHTVGNHTQHHLNGWKTDNETYINDIIEAKKWIDSTLFRPPYGRIKAFQAKVLQQQLNTEAKTVPFKIVMWTVLSGDFDTDISGEKCFDNVKDNTNAGSIVVFHDSQKAFERLSYALPKTLAYFKEKGFVFKSIPNHNSSF